MKIKLNRLNDDFLFECTNEQGNSILLDNTTLPGAKGVSPMQSLLMAVAGCSGIDLVSILKNNASKSILFLQKLKAKEFRWMKQNLLKA